MFISDIIVFVYHLTGSGFPGVNVFSFKNTYSGVRSSRSKLYIRSRWSIIVLYVRIGNICSICHSVVGSSTGNFIADCRPLSTCKVEETELGFVLTFARGRDYRQVGIVAIKLVHIKYPIIIFINVVHIVNTVTVSIGTSIYKGIYRIANALSYIPASIGSTA